MSSSLGTPVSALASAQRPGTPPPSGERVNLLNNVRAAAWFTTRLAVIKPLLAAAPAAKAISALLFQELVHLFPEHIAAEVAVAMGSFLARSASLLTETDEGRACVGRAESLYSDAVDCCSTAQGEQLAVESSEAVVRLVRALKSKEAKEFYTFCERAAHAALRVAGSSEASALVSSTRAALDATLDLAASDQATAALREAVGSVTWALRERRGDDSEINLTAANNDTLSECDDSDQEEEEEDTGDRVMFPPSSIPSSSAAKHAPRPPNAAARKTRKRSSFWIDNLTGLFIILLLICWTAFAIFGFVVLWREYYNNAAEKTNHHLHEYSLVRGGGIVEMLTGEEEEAPRPAPHPYDDDDDELL